MSKCKICRGEYQRRSMTQKTCNNVDCAIEWARRERVKAEKKAERAEFKKRKEAAKRPSDIKKEAQGAINAYCRHRDLAAGHQCICCGKPFEPNRPGGSIDGGHYLSRGSHPNLAFDERNINAQRKSCNRPGGTTAAAFRIGMIERYGIAVVEELESDTTPRRYRADDYRRIRDIYRMKLKELKSELDDDRND